MSAISYEFKASYAFIERNFNIVKRYWAWELVWLVYGIVNSLSVSFIGVVAGEGEFRPNWIFIKHIRLQGIYVGSREMFEAMNRKLVEKEIHPVVHRVFGMEQIREAYRYMESGAHFGKIVVRL